jgi:ferredoxin
VDDSGAIEVLLDVSKCQGYAICLGVAPDVFDIEPGAGVAHLLRTTTTEIERPVLDDAVRSCPAQAISLRG